MISEFLVLSLSCFYAFRNDSLYLCAVFSFSGFLLSFVHLNFKKFIAISGATIFVFLLCSMSGKNFFVVVCVVLFNIDSFSIVLLNPYYFVFKMFCEFYALFPAYTNPMFTLSIVCGFTFAITARIVEIPLPKMLHGFNVFFLAIFSLVFSSGFKPKYFVFYLIFSLLPKSLTIPVIKVNRSVYFNLFDIGTSVFQGVIGLKTGSMCLVSDSLQSLTSLLTIFGEVSGIFIKDTERYPFGLKRLPPILSLAIAIMLLFLAMLIISISIENMFDDHITIEPSFLILASVLSIASNLIGFVFFSETTGEWTPEKITHYSDLLTSFGSLISSFLVEKFGITFFDSIWSLVIAVFLMMTTVPCIPGIIDDLLLLAPQEEL